MVTKETIERQFDNMITRGKKSILDFEKL